MLSSSAKKSSSFHTDICGYHLFAVCFTMPGFVAKKRLQTIKLQGTSLNLQVLVATWAFLKNSHKGLAQAQFQRATQKE